MPSRDLTRAGRHALLTVALASAVAPAGASAGASAAGAQTPTTPPALVVVLAADSGSTLTIRGSTTIGARWHCTATHIDSRVAIAVTDDRSAGRIPDVRGVTIHLPVSALRCQSGPMERAMIRALKADRDTAARVITGRFEIYDDFAPPSPGQPHLAGALRVAGTERNVFLQSVVEPQADGSLHVRSVVPLLLSEFDITAPRVLFGAVRARDAVRVEVDLRYPAPRRP